MDRDSLIHQLKTRETEDNPIMLELFLDSVWQQVFCYSLVTEDAPNEHLPPKILMAIVAGSDSSLQAIKGGMDTGSGGFSVGIGEKGLSTYKYHSIQALTTDKGKYDKFPITLPGNRKALAMVHEELMNQEQYVLSFDGNPAEDVANLMGGSKYGLHLLDEWKDPVYRRLTQEGFLQDVPLYADDRLFPDGLHLYQIDMEEQQADDLVSHLIQEGTLTFPRDGNGEEVETTENLTEYMTNYSNTMVEKLAEKIPPEHDPTKDETLNVIEDFPRQLFPVQSHVTSAVAKHLQKNKAVIIQGEMSTGKSSIMTAVGESIHYLKHNKRKNGYFACLFVPPNLTSKWPEEIREIVPDADIHVIENTNQLIRFHSEWTRQGRPKPSKPTFFIFAFTTMRNDARIAPAVHHESLKTQSQKENGEGAYREGYICPDCGKPLQVIEEETVTMSEEGEEVTERETHDMEPLEFGNSRRLHSGTRPQNAFCLECGASLWTKKVMNRYTGFDEWTVHEKRVLYAIRQQNQQLYRMTQDDQRELPKKNGVPRKIAAVEYIRRKMKNFFDVLICDEVHEMKAGMSAQGNAFGSLVSASKKVIAGTGTLFGGKSEDIYYLLWRMFPQDMIAAGFKYHEVRKFNEEYGNIETTIYERMDQSEYSNTNSRGGIKRKEKIVPGISPFIYGRFMIHNVVNVRLKDVWPDPVPLVDTPTIFVDMPEELSSTYRGMISSFEHEINIRKDGHKLYLPMTKYGVGYPDNPFTYPSAYIKNEDEEEEEDVVWEAEHLSTDQLLPKEEKLQEIIQTEMAEGRKSIVYVRDTGSTNSALDVRPRLQEVLESIGAKVCVLDTTTTKTNNRTPWLKKKMTEEKYDVCITNQKLVKVGLDLIFTPTLIFYQFDWSLFTINQAARRAFRIGQTEECRLFYLAYRNTFQETMAELIAQKNRATAAINGEVSSDGLSAMLGDEGDLQSMLIKTVKNGDQTLKGSTEEWVHEQSERSRELLANIQKKKEPSIAQQLINWTNQVIDVEATKNVIIRHADKIAEGIDEGKIPGFSIQGKTLEVDLLKAFGQESVEDGRILAHLGDVLRKNKEVKSLAAHDSPRLRTVSSSKKKRKKQEPVDGQLAFEL